MTARLFDEYHPSQTLDADLSLFVEKFLSDCVTDFIAVVDSTAIPSLVRHSINLPVSAIAYKGGAINLPSDFYELVSFKHKEWQHSLGKESLITAQSPKRQLQSNRFTAGSVSRPIICLEYLNGLLSLCFWGWRKSKDCGNYLTYIKKVSTLEDIIDCEDWLLRAFAYYSLAFAFTTTKEIQLSDRFLLMCKEILEVHSIKAVLPVSFNNKTSEQ